MLTDTAHSLTVHHTVNSSQLYEKMTVNFCRYTMFCVLLSRHIIIVCMYSVLVSLSWNLQSVSQFSPLSVLVFSSAAPVSVDPLLVPMHAGCPLCELPRSLRCQSEHIYWSFSLNRTGRKDRQDTCWCWPEKVLPERVWKAWSLALHK